jgi:hypothetical protein
MHKLQQLLYAPLSQREAQSSAAVDGWISVEMQHLLPILTALGAGVLLGATCLLLEWGARRPVARKRRTRIKQKTPVGA